MATDLLDLLDEAASGAGGFRFLPDETIVTAEEMWRDAATAAKYLRRNAGADGAVGMLLESGRDCCAALAGAWRAGLRVVSLPHPARTISAEDYRRQVDVMCALAGAGLVLVTDPSRSQLDRCSVPVEAFGACDRGGPPFPSGGSPDLVQFTSGSTGSPKGVCLSLEAVAANVFAMADALEIEAGHRNAICSWLPLSHDMGLIGMCLTPWAGMSPRFAGTSELTLMRPETFLVNPGAWLSACSRFGAGITAAPNFALELCARRLERDASISLDALRAVVVGAEPVKADTLRRFAAAAAPNGFSEMAFCPAYGLAEATLAVSIVRPSEPWSATSVDAAALGEGRWTTSTGSGSVEVVSSGRPLVDTDIRVVPPPGTDVGEIQISTPSLLSAYLASDSSGPIDGWFATRDLGCLAGGELHVTGRHSDVIIVAGRNLYASDLESVVNGHRMVRSGNSVVVDDGDGRYVVVAERRRGQRGQASMREACQEIRVTLAGRFGAGPSSIVLLRPGSFPRTPSGKLQRSLVGDAFRRDELPTDCVMAFDRKTFATTAKGAS